MATYRLMDGVAGRPGVGSSGTTPPGVTSYSGNFLAGTAFQVTQGGMWLQSFWFWCPSGGDTGPQKFALWSWTSGSAGQLIAAATVTSGTLTANSWNEVTLSAPVPLAIGSVYVAATGWSAVNGFPDSQNQFGSGDPYGGGITNGPLYGFSDGTDGGTGTKSPITAGQGLFSTAGTDPSVNMPDEGSASSLFWVDVQVSDTAPVDYAGSYRVWPNKFDVTTQLGAVNATDLNDNYILGTEFTLSQACTLNNIWFYSPSGATQLPTQCCIWDVGSQAMVSGTLKTSPGWSGAAGSGWVAASYSGVALAAGDYKVSVWNGAGSIPSGWNVFSIPYFFTGGSGVSGITTGPITVPDAAAATSPGQCTYEISASAFAYPDLYVAAEGQNYWLDVEVTPAALPKPLVVSQAVSRAATY